MSEDQNPAIDELDLDETIEGGEIELDEPLDLFHERHKAETARVLAYVLVAALAGSFVLHYIAVAVLGSLGKDSTVQYLTDLFGNWLPVISGLTGGAATYFFTRAGKQ